jgi:hypothetical protein
LSPRIVLRMVLLLLAAMLASCGGGGGGDSSVAVDAGDSGAAPVRNVSVSSVKPVDAYVIVGGHIKSCWFNPTKPLLPNYVYRADVSPDGAKVQISVHDREALGRAGLTDYIVDFKQDGPATVITTENRKMPPDLAAKMEFDIDRWKRGESDCNNVRPPAGAAAAAPPVTQAR